MPHHIVNDSFGIWKHVGEMQIVWGHKGMHFKVSTSSPQTTDLSTKRFLCTQRSFSPQSPERQDLEETVVQAQQQLRTYHQQTSRQNRALEQELRELQVVVLFLYCTTFWV